jgi:hypothetical protein
LLRERKPGEGLSEVSQPLNVLEIERLPGLYEPNEPFPSLPGAG